MTYPVGNSGMPCNIVNSKKPFSCQIQSQTVSENRWIWTNLASIGLIGTPGVIDKDEEEKSMPLLSKEGTSKSYEHHHSIQKAPSAMEKQHKSLYIKNKNIKFIYI